MRNILARVTGGRASAIDGTLASTITGADLWLVNPNGVMFGAGAQLALRGAFHASTGSYVRLADGSIFSAANPDAGGLTIAAPEAFGFLGGETGRIDVDVSGNALASRPFERFSLVGGDISIHGGDEGGTLSARNGRVDLVAVGSSSSSPVEVALYSGDAQTLDVTGPWSGRSVAIRGTVLSSSGFPSFPGGGDINIVGGSMLFEDAELNSFTTGSERGGNISIDLSGDLTMRSTNTGLTAFSAGSGVGGFALNGHGGDVDIRAQNVSLLDGAQISTTTRLLGDAGDVSIDARGVVRIAGRNSDGTPSGIFSSTLFSGAGGRIAIAAPRLELDDRGVIVTETQRLGAGGSIDIDVDQLVMRGGARIDTSTRSFESATATGGTIH
ncbi:MAG: filamentous hemagglutinin N-terminal domain-containing protein, partial [Solirubrobacteraceae bacterium]